MGLIGKANSPDINEKQKTLHLIEALYADPTFNLPKSLLFESFPVVMDYVVEKHSAENDGKDIVRRVQNLLPIPTTPMSDSCATIMEEIRSFLSRLDVAKDGDANVHWNKMQSTVRNVVVNFDDPRYVVYFAQSHASGFDHRCLNGEEAVTLISKKIGLLNQITGINSLLVDEICESPYSLPQGQVSIYDRPYSSSIFWHGHFYLRILQNTQVESELSILEIGGGYGGLARLLLRSGRVGKYVIVDLPESLICAHAFLRLNFPELRVHLAASEQEIDQFGDCDVLLVPATLKDGMKGENFDLVINTGSLQEMPRSTAEEFVQFVENDINTRYFYSVNYTFEQKYRHVETIQKDDDEENLVAPVLDKNWSLCLFMINPPDLLTDSPRNWLEVLVERKPQTEHSPAQIPGGGFTQEWFAAVWMELWKAPTKTLIDQYLQGVVALSNHRTDIEYFRATKFDYSKIGEVRYWRKIKETLSE